MGTRRNRRPSVCLKRRSGFAECLPVFGHRGLAANGTGLGEGGELNSSGMVRVELQHRLQPGLGVVDLPAGQQCFRQVKMCLDVLRVGFNGLQKLAHSPTQIVALQQQESQAVVGRVAVGTDLQQRSPPPPRASSWRDCRHSAHASDQTAGA